MASPPSATPAPPAWSIGPMPSTMSSKSYTIEVPKSRNLQREIVLNMVLAVAVATVIATSARNIVNDFQKYILKPLARHHWNDRPWHWRDNGFEFFISLVINAALIAGAYAVALYFTDTEVIEKLGILPMA